MSEIEKCAWCQREPIIETAASVDYFECYCELSDSDSLLLKDWNSRQNGILAVRRKDFEAGANYGERAAKDHTEDNVEEAFDDYLKETK